MSRGGCERLVWNAKRRPFARMTSTLNCVMPWSKLLPWLCYTIIACGIVLRSAI